MFTVNQLVAHAVGDYILQSDWMANKKTSSHLAAAVHALTYAIPFLFLTRSPLALILIIATHFVIDRYRLARYVCWAKNWIAPRGEDHTLTPTGYPADRPAWLSTWLLIITDNLLHVLLNGAILYGVA